MTAITPTPRQPIRASSVASALNDNTEIASNFTTFLQLLTTQLQNQDPLSPMDTNQFTQQLVEFAGVEQQMKTNDTLSTLVSLQQSAQTTQALSAGRRDRGRERHHRATRQWPGDLGAQRHASRRPPPSRSRRHPARPPIPARSRSIPAARLSSGTASAMTARYGRPATTRSPPARFPPAASRPRSPPRWRDKVTSVDLTQTPPALSISGQNYTINDIQRIVVPGT